MKTLVISRSELQDKVRRDIESSRSSFVSMMSGHHNFFYKNRAAPVQPIDVVRWLSEHIPASKETLHTRNMVLNAVSNAEARCAGSGIVTMAVACDVILTLGGKSGQDATADAIYQWTRRQLERSHRCQTTDALEIMRLFDGDTASLSLAKKILRSCSSNASISIESSGEITQVKEVHGHMFPCRLPDLFTGASNIAGRKHLDGPRVIVIDGMVERMSEIDDVIRGSYESRTPLVLFARGFDPEVQNTLAKNYLAGNLVAVPVCVPYDELGANLLNDVSIVCGADLVSSLKGELISSRKWKDLKAIDSTLITSGRVTIINETTADSVRRQRYHLGEKKKTCAGAESEIVDRRLQCLMGKGVIANIGSDMGDLRGLYSDRVGSHIRLFRNCARQGITRLDQEVKRGSALDCLTKKFPIFSASALSVGVQAGIACARSANTVGGMVCLDSADLTVAQNN